MANELDEATGPVNEAGQDINVINKQLPVKVGAGTKFLEVFLWFLLIIPGIVFQVKKVKAAKTLSQLQQKLQHDASQIDNYLEQRVIILENLVGIIEKETTFEKDTLSTVMAYRSGINPDQMNEAQSNIENVQNQIKAVFENYPDLKSAAAFEKAMKDNDYLQREITAARELYNDSVQQWNALIFEWPVYQLVAAKKGYTTRIPFTTTKEMKDKARSKIF